MNRRPLFAAIAVFLFVSCQDDSEKTEAPNAETMEDKLEEPFLMPIEDVFMIQGRGVIVVGLIDRGVITLEDEIEIVGLRETQSTTVKGIEMYKEVKESGQAGENVGILLSGVRKEDVERGMVLSKPGAITAHTKFEADLKMLTPEEGGRSTPIFDGFRPHYYFWTMDVTGVTALAEGTGSVKPGEGASISVELNTSIAFEIGTNFAVREGGRTVGTGVVTAIPLLEE